MAEMSKRAQSLCRSAPWRGFARRVVLPWALQGVELHGDVLEIGCGSGAMAAEMLHRFPSIRLTATDYDEAMVEAARVRLAAFGDRASVRRADATALPFGDATFDVVATFIMLHHVIAWESALAEIARVLRPGGTLVGYDVVGDGVGRIVNGREHGTRRMRMGELRDELDRLAYADVRLRRGAAGLTVRFRSRRASG